MLFASLLMAAAGAGCAAPQPNVLKVTSFRDPYFPEPHDLAFSRCVYGQGRDRDRHIVAQSSDASSEEGEIPVQRVLHLQVFWQPRPGRTFADPSLTDATARYLVLGPRGMAVYTGTAFVYPRNLPDGRLECRIESGTLRLETVDGDPPPTIGDARLEGLLVALADQNTTVDLRRKVDLYAAGAFRGRYAGSPEKSQNAGDAATQSENSR